MYKGSWERPHSTSKEERDLRWMLATGYITLEEFEREYQELRKQGLIYRR